MLVVSRKIGETIHFPVLGVEVQVVGVHGQRVKIGVNAPLSISVLRGELLDSLEIPESISGVSQDVPHPVDRSEIASIPGVANLARHAWKNRIHAALLGLYLAQKQLAAGKQDQGLETLAKSIQQLRELESIQANPPALDFRSIPNPGNPSNPDQQLDQHRSAPIISPVVSPEGSGATLKSSQRQREVLLVDDDVNERSLLSGLLEMDGFKVRMAGDGVEALNILKTCRPNFVLLDMQMPNLNGQQTISRIRSHLQFRNLPVFAVSGLTAEEAGVSIGKRGIDRWFSKPLNPLQLLGAIRELCV